MSGAQDVPPEQFQLLAENMPVLCWIADPTGFIYWYNRRWYEYTGTTPAEMAGWGWQSVHDPATIDSVLERWRRSLATGQPFDMEFPLRGADGVYRTFLTRIQPFREGGEAIKFWFGNNVDISELKRAERHRELLINELNHRVKNTLAIVQGMARQSFRELGHPAETSLTAFEDRLAALSIAHDLLTNEHWENTTLKDLAEVVLRQDLGRISLSGPPLALAPKAAVNVAMALHELWTNARKHGALSRENGGVEVHWSVSDRLEFRWRETGGPSITAPTRHGFGSRLIHAAFAVELNGEIEVDYRPGGLAVTVRCPIPPLQDEILETPLRF